jgi:peptide/nickel transport system substrate-binding protein
MRLDKNQIVSDFASSSQSSVSRREVFRLGFRVGLTAIATTSLLAACVEDDVDDDAEEPVVAPNDDTEIDSDDDIDDPVEDDDNDVTEPDDTRYGGEVRVALIGEPPSGGADVAFTTSATVAWHYYEPLFTWDSEFAPVPDLVDTWDVSEDGLLNTLRLREGVLFHNGQEMIADDVDASIDRWANVLGIAWGQQLINATDSINIVDDYTLEFEMSEPFGTFAVVLARQNNGCVIYPKELVDAAGSEPIEDRIGTGPYRFVEHQPDRHVLVERFEDYSYRDEPSDGYGGRKHAYPDAIRFMPVPDESARITGLQSGEYDFLEDVTPDQFEAIEDDPAVVAEIAAPTSNDLILFNLDQGIMTDINLRRAIQALIDPDEILLGAHGADNYRLGPGFMWEETIWHSNVGEELYNLADPELAREYLDAAGYDGEEVRIITTNEYADMYNTGILLAQQLEDLDINTDLQVFDWATMLETRNDTSVWDITITGFTFRVDPTQFPFMRCDWGGIWCTDRKVELVDRLFAEVELDDRLEAWEELQALLYEEVPLIKTGEAYRLLAYSNRLQNVEMSTLAVAPSLWNTWIEE